MIATEILLLAPIYVGLETVGIQFSERPCQESAHDALSTNEYIVLVSYEGQAQMHRA